MRLLKKPGKPSGLGTIHNGNAWQAMLDTSLRFSFGKVTHVQLQGDEQLSFENKLAFASMVGMAKSSPRQMWLFLAASTSWRVLKKCLLVELFQPCHVSTAST